MMNLDRFSQGLPDPQEEEPVGECEGCGGEIYASDLVYNIEGTLVHVDLECLEEFYHLIKVLAEGL